MEFKWKTPSGDDSTESGKVAEPTTKPYFSTSDIYGQICRLVILLNRLESPNRTYSFEVCGEEISVKRFTWDKTHRKEPDLEHLYKKYHPIRMYEDEERLVVEEISDKLMGILTEIGGNICGK